MNLQALCEVAVKAATEAGALIASYREQVPVVEQKKAGETQASQVVTAVDRLSQEVILKQLKPSCEAHDLGLLTEEMEDDGSRFAKDFFWCIDPLDGTLPFIEKKSGFAVSIALVAKEGIPLLGVVHDPVTKNTYHAIKGQKAFRNGKPFVLPPQGKALTFVADRSMLTYPQFEQVRSDLLQKAKARGLEKVEIIAHGGVVMNAIWVLEHPPACYFKFPKPQAGGGSLWDFAATACIFRELKLPATTYHGGPLDLNRKGSTFMNHEGVYFDSSINRLRGRFFSGKDYGPGVGNSKKKPS